MSAGATRQLLFNNPTDLVNIESGGLLRSNNNNATTIGNTTNRGQLTAGGAAPGAGPVDLYFHVNQNTATVNSVIVNQPEWQCAGPVGQRHERHGGAHGIQHLHGGHRCPRRHPQPERPERDRQCRRRRHSRRSGHQRQQPELHEHRQLCPPQIRSSGRRPSASTTAPRSTFQRLPGDINTLAA